MIEIVAAGAPTVAALIGARLRGWRLNRRHAEIDAVERAATARAEDRAARAELATSVERIRGDVLTVQLAETSERLIVAEQDRDEFALIGATHLRRAWRAERALAAVRARDEQAAYVEQGARDAVAAAERITQDAAPFPRRRFSEAVPGEVFEPIFDGEPPFPGGAS